MRVKRTKFFFIEFMDNQIVEPDENFDFNALSLSQPNGLQGGSYFTKLLFNNNPLYIQSPRCSNKQGIVNSNKKVYCDLIYNNSDTVFIDWIEKLEQKCQELIYEKKDYWFHNDIDMNDIETAFTSPIKTYKSGTKYLIRTNLSFSKQVSYKPLCNVYDEDENLLTLNEIKNDVEIIPLIHINGIKFSSKSFIFDLIVKQFMILKNDKQLDGCLIKKTNIKENQIYLEKTINNPVEIKTEDSVETKTQENPLETKTQEKPVETKTLEESVEIKTQEKPVETKIENELVEIKTQKEPVEIKTQEEPIKQKHN